MASPPTTRLTRDTYQTLLRNLSKAKTQSVGPITAFRVYDSYNEFQNLWGHNLLHHSVGEIPKNKNSLN